MIDWDAIQVLVSPRSKEITVSFGLNGGSGSVGSDRIEPPVPADPTQPPPPTDDTGGGGPGDVTEPTAPEGVVCPDLPECLPQSCSAWTDFLTQYGTDQPVAVMHQYTDTSTAVNLMSSNNWKKPDGTPYTALIHPNSTTSYNWISPVTSPCTSTDKLHAHNFFNQTNSYFCASDAGDARFGAQTTLSYFEKTDEYYFYIIGRNSFNGSVIDAGVWSIGPFLDYRARIENSAGSVVLENGVSWNLTLDYNAGLVTATSNINGEQTKTSVKAGQRLDGWYKVRVKRKYTLSGSTAYRVEANVQRISGDDIWSISFGGTRGGSTNNSGSAKVYANATAVYSRQLVFASPPTNMAFLFGAVGDPGDALRAAVDRSNETYTLPSYCARA